MSHRKTVVVLKMSSVPLQSSSLQPPKFNVDKPTKWLGYSLWHLLKISLRTLKNSMRCAKKILFLWFWWRQLAACRRLKYASYRGSWGERSCPRSATAIHSVSVNRTNNLPIERWTLHHWAIAASAKSSSAMPRCQHGRRKGVQEGLTPLDFENFSKKRLFS